jgi:hypothetical protein
MPRGWHPPNPAQQTSHAHGEYPQAEVEEQGIGHGGANEEADDSDDEGCHDQEEGQGEENNQEYVFKKSRVN